MSDPTVQVMVRFRSDQVERLRAEAEADDRSMAYIVRKAVDWYLEWEGPAMNDCDRTRDKETP